MASLNVETDSATSTSVETAQNLLMRYEDQILNGCSNAACTEVLCHTGRINGSQKPVRGYTARSARAIALTVCSGPDPRAHLCHYRAERSTVQRQPSSEPRDPSALIQLLSDTNAASQMCSNPTDDRELRRRHHELDQLVARAGGQLESGRLLSNTELVEAILPDFDRLLDFGSTQRLAVWAMIDREIISKGFTCPSKLENKPNDEGWNSWIVILDRLNDEPNRRHFRHIMQTIGTRLKLEALNRRESSDKTTASPRSLDSTERGIVAILVQRLIKKESEQEYKALPIMVWLKRLFADVWDGKPLVMQQSLTHVILEILQEIRHEAEGLQDDAFKMPLIRLRIADMDLALSRLPAADGVTKHILEYQYLFVPDELITCFRAVNLLSMSQANSKAVKNCEYRRRRSISHGVDLERHSAQLQHEEEHYLLLYVSRERMLKDAFDQLWQRRTGELRRPLRVRMGADELDIGHDLGGVQVEFLNIVCRQVFSEEAQLFTTDAQTGVSYLRAGSLQPLHMFELFGMLLALAVYNGITLPIRLPLIFYRLLSCDFEKYTLRGLDSLRLIQDGWPALAKSLQSLRGEFVDDLEFAFPIEANGLRLSCLPLEPNDLTQANDRRKLKVVDATATGQLHGAVDMTPIKYAWPGWELTFSEEEPHAVTPEDVERYIRTYAWWLCYSSVQPQLEALLHGFQSSELISRDTLSILGPEHLKAYVEGADFLDIQDLRAATRYDGYEAKQKYIQSFWRIVAAWTQEKQKLLLKFVTATERIPIAGASHLTFIIKRAHPDSIDALPTSSTCFGTLLLPRYASPEIMAAKLDLALNFGAEGFGTG
ncbi:Putative ubiquitin- ligase E3A zinc-binding protein [Septoria linicola]|uniref:HECT-type E3 ubiquitin transferase n=1 Tax=Septoria linicola TaxID=215465 RepID=A0A9Q9AI23_9PEZI|nr:Putative ubiquitin- ligase E3A zinc-binding protein [Septoria linicola]